MFAVKPYPKYEIIAYCSKLHFSGLDVFAIVAIVTYRLKHTLTVCCCRYAPCVLVYGPNCEEYYLMNSPVESSIRNALDFCYYVLCVVVSIFRDLRLCLLWTLDACLHAFVVHYGTRDQYIFRAKRLKHLLQTQTNVEYFSILRDNRYELGQTVERADCVRKRQWHHRAILG